MSRKSLWDFYDGEPFMENPHLAIVGANPRKKGQKMAARRTRRNARRRGRKAAPRRNARRRTARRNPFPSAGLAFNPRRRRSRGRKNAPRRHHRRARRNPALLGVTLPPITMLAWGAGGFLATPMLEGFVTKFLPASITANTLGRYATKIASVLGLTWAVKAIMGNKEAFPVAMGGSMYVIVSAVNEFAPQLTQIPSAGPLPPTMGAYRSGQVNAYRGGMVNTGVNGYAKTGFSGALPNLARALPQLAQPSTQMSPYSLNISGMTNPVFADPRFSYGNSVSR